MLLVEYLCLQMSAKALVNLQARSQKHFRGVSKASISPGNVAIFRPLSLILMALMFFVFFGVFTKSIIAKQFEGSRIKCMCIFHVLMVRGALGQRGGFRAARGLPGNADTPDLRYAPKKTSRCRLMKRNGTGRSVPV